MTRRAGIIPANIGYPARGRSVCAFALLPTLPARSAVTSTPGGPSSAARDIIVVRSRNKSGTRSRRAADRRGVGVHRGALSERPPRNASGRTVTDDGGNSRAGGRRPRVLHETNTGGLRLGHPRVLVPCRAWKCPARRILQHHDEHISVNHLDVGVGTGYFLDKCRFSSEAPRVALMDLNRDCLAVAERRIARYRPETYQANVLEPVVFDAPRSDSIGMSYLLHCVPRNPIQGDRLPTHERVGQSWAPSCSGLPCSMTVSIGTSWPLERPDGPAVPDAARRDTRRRLADIRTFLVPRTMSLVGIAAVARAGDQQVLGAAEAPWRMPTA